MKGAHLRSSRSAYRGRVIEVTVDTVELPNGNTSDLEIVRHPGAAVIVPVDGGEVVLVRQYRWAATDYLLEAPAGKLDKGESPEACARRELTEETGLTAKELISLGFVFASPGFTDERLHLFLARGLAKAKQALEADEVLSVERVPFSEAVRLAETGAITDAKSVCALLRARAYLERKES
jgi:ADP-ribose pyrophosphatase